MKYLLLFVVVVGAGLLITAPAAAQDPGSGGPEPGNPQGPTEVPLDGGVSLLLAGGAAYALRRLRQKPS